MVRVRFFAVLLLFIPPVRTEDERFEAFSKAWFSSGLARLGPSPRPSDFVKARLFSELLSAEIRKDALSTDNQIDFEILETKLGALLDGYRTFGPSVKVPVEALPPNGFLKTLLALSTPETWTKHFAIRDDGVNLDFSASNEEALKHIDALVDETEGFAVAAVLSGADGSSLKAAGEFRERLQAFRRTIADAKPGERSPPKREPTARERYLYALKYTLLTHHTPESLLELAMARWDDTIARLEACAKRIDGAKTWREIIEECKREAYRADEYHDEAEKLARQACEFAIEKDLMTIPESAKDFAVVKGSKGQITPFGHYRPGMGRTKGSYVTAPVDGIEEELLKERLRDNNKYWTKVVALHEAVPGHHLQFEVAKTQKRSAIRQAADTSTYVEGWGLYCEEMMFRNGYYEDGTKQRLTALKMRLWRCARVVIDVGLQTGSMTKDDAVKLLTEQVTLEPSSARLEVEHYASRPTYFCGYLIGFLTFTELYESVKKELGGKFEQKAFHDAILNAGPMPLPQLKRAVMARMR